jgi:hypothetical protein
MVEGDQFLVDRQDAALLGLLGGDRLLAERRLLVGVPLGDLRRTGERGEAPQPLVAIPRGEHGDEPVADESGVVLVALDDLAAEQFAGDDLEQRRVDAGAGLAEQGGRVAVGAAFPQPPQVADDAAGAGEFVVAEVVDGDATLVQQLADLVVEALGTEGLDERGEVGGVHGVFQGRS